MARFKIRLIVPNNDDDSINSTLSNADISEHFLATNITDFSGQINQYNENKEIIAKNTTADQTDINDVNSRSIYHAARNVQKCTEDNPEGILKGFKHSVAYTYDEQFAIHKNGQKDLSFKLDDKVLSDSAWELNPYARVLHVGTLLELTDKYNNIYLFIITNITPQFSNINITYTYTCQDLFTYQLSRQNEGYNLVNDAQSVNFIGALNIDEWAKRITKDCYIQYTYVSLTDKVIRYTDGKIAIVRGEGLLEGVDSVLKQSYNATVNPEFFETFPFSVSGSNASAALISLADTTGMQLVVAEGYSSISTEGDIIYNRYFWYAPSKKADNSGLTYSPKRDIQNFSLSLDGTALTTVLNVNSTTWEDEEIGLFPTIPQFFTQYFNSTDWEESKYYPGFFKELVTGDHREDLVFSSFITSHTHDSADDYYTIELTINNWRTYYNRIQLYWDNTHFLHITTNTNLSLTPFNTAFYLLFADNEGSNNNYVVSIEDEIPVGLIERVNNGLFTCYLAFKSSEEGLTSAVIQANYVILTRNYTQEELDFAEIAEQCPWLENKLIDFSYFLHQNIISPSEYKNIMTFMTNNIRILNGKLMAYANAYYNAIHKQTTIVAQLQNTLDGLGAEYYNSVIAPFEDTGRPSNNISTFKNNYDLLFQQNNEFEKQPLFNFNKLVSENFNNYFQAEQRCLRNLYEFRRFFNSRNSFATNSEAIMEDVTYSIQNAIKSTSDNFYLYSFDTHANFQGLTSADSDNLAIADGTPLMDLYKYRNKHYIKQIIPSLQTIKDKLVLVPRYETNSMQPVSANEYYNSSFDYAITATAYETIFGKKPTHIIGTYAILTLYELKQLYLAQNPTAYYIRDPDYYISYNDIRFNWYGTQTPLSRFTAKFTAPASGGAVSRYLMPFLGRLAQYNEKILNLFGGNTKLNVDSSTYDEVAWRLYKAYMPIDNLYFQDVDLRLIDNEWKCIDENGYPYIHNGTNWTKYNIETKTYETYTGQPYKRYYNIPFVSCTTSNNSIWENVNEKDPISSLKDLKNVLQDMWSLHDSANKYYTCNVNTKAKNWATIGTMAATGFHPLGIIGSLIFFNNRYGKKLFLQWTQNDNPEYSMSYWINNDWKKYYSGAAEDVMHWEYGDCSVPNYTLTEDAEDTVIELTNSWVGYSNSQLKTFVGNTWKHYTNYFSQIAATYSLESSTTPDVTFYIKERCASFIYNTTILNVKEPYYLIPREVNIDSHLIRVIKPLNMGLSNGRFNVTKWYPAVAGKTQLDMSFVTTPDGLIDIDNYVEQLNERLTDFTVTKGIESSEGSMVYLTFAGTNGGGESYYIIHDEPYHRTDLTSINYKNYINDLIYRKDNHLLLTSDFTVPQSVPGTSGGVLIYKIAKHDIDLITVDEKQEIDLTWNTEEKLKEWYGHWYNRAGENINSIYEIIGDNDHPTTISKYYAITGSSYKTVEFYDSNTSQRIFKPIIHRFAAKLVAVDESSGYEDSDEPSAYDLILEPADIDKVFDGSNAIAFNDSSANTTFGEDEITITRSATTTQIGNLTNGAFWYKFHARDDFPALQEAAAVIETQLTMNWTAAYNASQYCRWFVPEYWQLRENNTNHFAPYIWTVISDNEVTLNSQLVPEVELYRSSNTEDMKNYTFYYDDSRTTSEYEEEMIPLKDAEDLVDNPAVNDCLYSLLSFMKSSTIDPRDFFFVKEYGKRSYYYVTNGGLLWKDSLKFFTDASPEIEFYTGLYGMQVIRLIRNYYAAESPKYLEYASKKLLLWKQLYTRYPGVFLEKVYSNNNVRSSKQLLQMSLLVMQDYTAPEKQYNITTIDIAALEGYTGQELTIGDNILLETSDFYTDVDDMYRSLNQYLFISDISYSLRQDTDIKLTVNTIKYQDKLLQSIVKLIR